MTGEPSVSQSSSSSEDNNTATTQKKPKTIHRCILQRVSKSKTSQAKLKCHVCDSCYQSYRQYYAHLIDSTCAQRKETKLARESAAAAASAAVPPQPTPTSPPSSSADPNVAHVVVPRKEHRTTAATTGLRDIRKAVRQQQQPPAVMSTAAVTTPTTSSLASPGIRSHYVVRSNSNSTVQMKVASPEPQAVENVGEPPSKYFRVSTAEANAFSSNNNGLLRKRKPSNLAVFKLKLPPSSSSPRGLKDLGGGADSSPIPAERYGHNRTPLKPLVSPALPALVMTVPKLISPLELQMSSSASSSGSSSAAAAAEETTADIRPQSGLGEAMEAMNSSQAAADYSNENDAPLNLSKTPTAGERSSINDATMAAGDENGVVPTMTMMEMPALLPLRKRNSLASTPEEMISPGQEQQTIPSSPAKIRKIAASPVCQKWTGSKCPHTETASLPSLSLMEHAMDQAKLATLKVKLTNLLISFLGEDRVIEMGYPETDILGVLQDLLRASNVPVLTAEDGCSEGCRQMAESVSHTQLKFRFLRKETEVARGNIQRMLENVYMEDSAELKQNLWA